MPDTQVGATEDIEQLADDVFAGDNASPMAPGTGAVDAAPETDDGPSVEYQPLVEEPKPKMAHAVESKWDVLAMGEMQQPGGVGAVHNPVIEGPNPDGPNFQDNADNSHEQQVALQRWVDVTVDMLNRGENPDAVLAKLAHDGCPDPEAILQRAMQQPQKEQPVTDEASAAAQSVAPPVDSGGTTTLPQGVQASRSMGDIQRTRRRVHVAGMGDGTVLAEFKDIYDREVVKVALDEGNTVDTAPEHVKDIAEAVDEPVERIQSFLDSLPPVNPEDRKSVAARVENIKIARNACAQMLSSSDLPLDQQVQLDALHTELADDLKEFTEYLGGMSTAADKAAIEALPTYEVGAHIIESASLYGHGKADEFMENYEHVAGDAHAVDWRKEVREGAAIFVSELPAADIETGYYRDLAGAHIRRKTAGIAPKERAEIIAQYMDRVGQLAQEREQRISTVHEDGTHTEKTAATNNDDGPASGLFL